MTPLISGQILFLQVSTQITRARPEASRNNRRNEVRAKNLEGKQREHSYNILMPVGLSVNKI